MEQAIRSFLTYRGAVHKKVVQRHRGYKYLNQLIASHLVRDKAFSRFLFGPWPSGRNQPS